MKTCPIALKFTKVGSILCQISRHKISKDLKLCQSGDIFTKSGHIGCNLPILDGYIALQKI